METRIIKVTDKGQISIPIEIRKSIGIGFGDELIAIRNGETICLKKIKKEDFGDLLKHSESVANKFWGNKADEIWDSV